MRQLVVIDYDQAGHYVAVTAEVLCSTVDNDVYAQFNRSLQVRRHKGVVNNRKDSMLFGKRSDCRKVGDRQKRISGTFDEDRLDVGGDLLFKRVQIRSVLN